MGLLKSVNQWLIKQYGTGPRVYVGLHGWNGDHTSFDSLLPYLPSDVTLYTLDFPGYGQSAPPEVWSLDGICDALVQQIASLELTSFTLVGNCSGAMFGMSAMRNHPLPVERVVIIDTFAYMPWYFRIFLWPVVGRLFYYSTFANPIGRWLTNLSLRNQRKEGSDLTGSFTQAPLSTPYRYLQAIKAMNDYRSFQHITTPVDITFGEHSFGAVLDSVSCWQINWPDAKAYPLEGAGHLSVVEAPEALSKILFFRNDDAVG